MKIAVISDIHGNMKVLDFLIDYIKKENIQKVLNLGDILGGEEPIEVLKKVMNDKRFINVAGNHDKSLEFIEDSLNQREREWLKNLPEKKVVNIQGKRFLMLHSRMNSNTDIPILYNDGKLTDFLNDYNGEWEYVLFGHTHYQCLLSFYEGKTMINPGSLGLSYDEKISFAVIEIDNNEFSIKFKKLDYTNIDNNGGKKNEINC